MESCSAKQISEYLVECQHESNVISLCTQSKGESFDGRIVESLSQNLDVFRRKFYILFAKNRMLLEQIYCKISLFRKFFNLFLLVLLF